MKHPLFQYLEKNQFITGLLIIALLWFTIIIRSVLVALFVAYIIMAALLPLVNFLQKKRVPKQIAVLISYFLTLAFIFLLIVPLIPFFSSQIQQLFSSLPSYINEAAQLFGVSIDPKQVQSFLASDLGSIGKNAFAVTQRVFGGIFSVLMVFALSYYLLNDHERTKTSIARFFPQQFQNKTLHTLTLIEETLGAWTRGQIILSVFIGAITWILLTILRIDFALPLALIAGILEIVPTLGPILASIPAIIVALNISVDTAIFVSLIYFIIQVIENNILVPRIMQKAVGLNPIIVILAVVIGGNLLGVIGALLAVPFLSILIIIFQNIRGNQSS